MNDEFCQDLRKRYDSLQTDRNNAMQQWEEIEAFVCPYRGQFFNETKTEGGVQWSRGFAYDSTAVVAHQNLSASLHGSLSSPAIRWFEIRFRSEELNKIKAVAEWLHNANEALYYAIQDSNFNVEVNETYQDMTGFGTAGLSLEEERDRLLFSAIPLKEFCFEEDFQGKALRFYRKLQWPASKIISKFGDLVPQRIKEMDEAGNTDPQDILFCVYPTKNKIVALGEKVQASRRPWGSCYFMYQGCEMLGKPDSYYEMPIFIPRWRKTSGSVWGNSPAHFALADIKSLNRMRKIQLIGSEKKIDPPTFAEERALFADLDLSAASLNIVRNVAGIKQFDTNFDIYVSDHMVNQLQQAIKDHFFTDQLRLPDPQGTPATAYEISLRYQQMQKLLGPTLGRLQNDLLDPIVGRAFKILARSGAIPPPPLEVIEANAEFDIEYIGSLSTAQKSDRAAGIERFMVAVANMSPVMPEVLDTIVPDEAVRQLARDLAIPPLLLRDKDEVEELQDERKQAIADMQSAEIMRSQGEGRQAINEAQLTQQSPLAGP